MSEPAPRIRPPDHQACAVTWIDSVRHEKGWDLLTEYAKGFEYEAMLHYTIGFVVHENDDQIVLVPTISLHVEDVSVEHAMQIPKLAVIDRSPVKVPELKPRREASVKQGSDAA